MSIFEAGMLVCFGAGWPFSIARALRTRIVAGKSPAFLAIVAAGYACGILHKLLYALDGVVFLYALNLTLVLADLALYVRFRMNPADG